MDLTDTYSITLNTLPTGDVNIVITPDGQTTIATKDMLMFTTENWNVAQTITVTAIDDVIPEGDHISILTHEICKY